MKDLLICKVLHGEVCLTACLNKIKVLIGKHIFRYFKENSGTHLGHANTDMENALHRCSYKDRIL